jgi:hypothetical protein
MLCDGQRDGPQLMYLLPFGSALLHRRPSLFPVRWTRSPESALCPCSTSWHGFLARAGPPLHGRKRKARSQTMLFRLRPIAPLATLARLPIPARPTLSQNLVAPPGQMKAPGWPWRVGRRAAPWWVRRCASDVPVQDISHDAGTPISPPRRAVPHVYVKPNTPAPGASASRCERQAPGSRAARRHAIHLTDGGPSSAGPRSPSGSCVFIEQQLCECEPTWWMVGRRRPGCAGPWIGPAASGRDCACPGEPLSRPPRPLGSLL